MRQQVVNLDRLGSKDSAAVDAAVAGGKAMWDSLLGADAEGAGPDDLLGAHNAVTYMYLRIVGWMVETGVIPPDAIRDAYIAMGCAIADTLQEANSLYDQEPEGHA